VSAETVAPGAPWDVAIIGAGAAGLATAIFAARRNPSARVLLLDGAAKIGAKILVSGGGRCNVTHREVRPADYNASSPPILRQVLAAFTVEQTLRWFGEMDVPLHLEETGKYFPNSNSARTVVDALLREVHRRGVTLRTSTRVEAISRDSSGFAIVAGGATFIAKRVVLATGGQSLPKSGSDGAGYRLAQALGHTITPTTPALVPLRLDGAAHAQLSGIAQPAAITIRADGGKPVRILGSLLWTHFGVSGPVVLDASRHWLRARLENRPVRATVSFLPDDTLESAEARWLTAAGERPRLRVLALLREWIPARVAEVLLREVGVDGDRTLAQCPRDERRKALQTLLEQPLTIAGSRGYNYAEVTAGGVPLKEIEPQTMQSRICPGLYLVGEILDVDGRIGGFNFQWAWASGYVAGNAAVIAE
jgi:predicted Rossmann fold flavoprotein